MTNTYPTKPILANRQVDSMDESIVSVLKVQKKEELHLERQDQERRVVELLSLSQRICVGKHRAQPQSLLYTSKRKRL